MSIQDVMSLLDDGGVLALSLIVLLMLRDHGRTLRSIDRGITKLCARDEERNATFATRRDLTPRGGIRKVQE
jgi:hypothetical protein